MTGSMNYGRSVSRRAFLRTGAFGGGGFILESRLGRSLALHPGTQVPPFSHSTEPQVTMPDGTPFSTWTDQTRYSRTYYVSTNNPRASDHNPGTETLPFKTINRAAQILKPGEKVVINAGVYREMIRQRYSGQGSDRMIAYEAAPGQEVIVKGSRVLSGRWKPSADPHRSVPPGADSHPGIYSKKLWMISLPDSLFDNGYFPFQIPNLTDAEFNLMPWALPWKGRIPYTLPRGLLFQDGRRMVQLATYEDLVHLPGSFWVAPGGKTVHIHPYENVDSNKGTFEPYDDVDPNGRTIEVAVQPHIFAPEKPGLGYIRVTGLTFEHCANGFARVGVGAFFTMGGHHWLVERNTIRHVNSVGLELGYQTHEASDPTAAPRTDPDLGHVIAHGNHVYDCGTAGMRGLGVNHGLVQYNQVTDCGWQDAEFHWEVAAIKLLVNRTTLVRNNYIARMQAGCGIWLDWDAQNSRVTGNVLIDVQTAQGAIFVEAAQQLNSVDNNFLWNIDGQGVRAADTDNLVIAQNFFGHILQDLVYARVATQRKLHGRLVSSTGNKVLNNIIVDARLPISSGDPSNVADYNVYVRTNPDSARVSDAGAHTVMMAGDIQFDVRTMKLVWKPAKRMSPVPLVTVCPNDFFGQARSAQNNVAGPFLELSRPTTLDLARH